MKKPVLVAARGDRPPEFLSTPTPSNPTTDPGDTNRREQAGPAALKSDAAIGQERPQNLPLVIESLLLASEEPPTISALARATNVSPDAVEQALDALERESSRRGIRLQRRGPSVQLVTAPEAAPFVERFLGIERPNRLSRAALETLAIIAYRQPITRSSVEAVRGVNCDGPLHTLRARELIEPLEQADTVGRPYLYGTTYRFLEHFGLRHPSELPSLPEPAPAALPPPVPLNGSDNGNGATPPDPAPPAGSSD